MRRAVCLGVALVLVGAAGAARAQGRAGGVTEEEDTFQLAEEAFKENKDGEALGLYEKVTNINPRRSEAWMKRAVILYKQKEYKPAVDVLVKARGLLPEDALLTGQLGLTLYKLGKTDAAVAFLEEAAGKQPEAYQFQLQLGQHYVNIGEGKKAALAFEAYFKHRPVELQKTDAQVMPFVGRAYVLDRQYAQAEPILVDVLKANPRDAIARAGLGTVYTAKGEWSKGIAMYERLDAEAPRQPSIWLNLATCLYKLNQRAEAEKNALAYTNARPQDPKGFLLLGDIRQEKGDEAGALAAYAEAKRLDAGAAADVAEREGRLWIRQKQFARAKEAFEAAAKTHPDEPAVLLGLAESYVATQQPKEKLVGVGEKLAKLPDAAPALLSAAAFYAADDDARALKQYEAAAAADPRSFRAKHGLAMTLNRLAGAAVGKGDLAAAEAALVRAEKLMPESVVTARNLGLVLVLLGRPADAEAPLLRARERVEKDLVVNRLLGRAAAAQKKRDDAIRYYEIAAQAGQKARGPQLAEVLAEVGPLYADAKRWDAAMPALETAVKEAAGSPVAAAAQRNLAIAYLRRGLERLDEPQQGPAALDDLGRAAAGRGLTAKEALAAQCALALATLKVGRPQAAMDGFAKAQREGGCQFKAPFDKLGQEFFASYALYRDGGNPQHADQAARAFQKLQGRASGALAEQLRDLSRSALEFEGVALFARNDRKRAATILKSASRMPGRAEPKELEHNLAVLDLEDGRLDAAARTFDQLGARPPEALVNLGLIRDRQGDPKKALELYKRGAERGARAPHLREWIDVKERMFSRGAAGAGGGK